MPWDSCRQTREGPAWPLPPTTSCVCGEVYLTLLYLTQGAGSSFVQCTGVASCWPPPCRRSRHMRLVDLRRQPLRSAVFDGVDMRGASLDGADLRGSTMYGTNLAGASLRGALLANANLQGANLQGANFSGAELTETDFTGAVLTDVDFSRALMRNAKIFSVQQGARAIFDGADLRDAQMTDNEMPNSSWVGTDLRAIAMEDMGLQRARIERADLAGARFVDMRMQGALLPRRRIRIHVSQPAPGRDTYSAVFPPFRCIPLYSSPLYSRGALNTPHNTVFTP